MKHSIDRCQIAHLDAANRDSMRGQFEESYNFGIERN